MVNNSLLKFIVSLNMRYNKLKNNKSKVGRIYLNYKEQI